MSKNYHKHFFLPYEAARLTKVLPWNLFDCVMTRVTVNPSGSKFLIKMRILITSLGNGAETLIGSFVITYNTFYHLSVRPLRKHDTTFWIRNYGNRFRSTPISIRQLQYFNFYKAIEIFIKCDSSWLQFCYINSTKLWWSSKLVIINGNISLKYCEHFIDSNS